MKRFPLLDEREMELHNMFKQIFGHPIHTIIQHDSKYPEYDSIDVDDDYTVSYEDGIYYLSKINHFRGDYETPPCDEAAEPHFHYQHWFEIERELIKHISEDKWFHAVEMRSREASY